MINPFKLRHILFSGVSLIWLSGCGQPIYDRVSLPVTEIKTVDVRVKHLGIEDERCQAELKTPGPKKSGGQACNGIGAGNGVACGRNEDIISWRGQGNVTISSISFVLGGVTDGAVCVDPSTLIGANPTCELKTPPAIPIGAGIAYKYRITYRTRERNCEVDPYIIVNRR